MILSAIAEKLKRWAKDDFKGRHFEATLILQAVSWYLRYPLSYRDIEELFLERPRQPFMPDRMVRQRASPIILGGRRSSLRRRGS